MTDALAEGQHAQELRDRGHSWTDIAHELGYPADTVRLLAKSYLAHMYAKSHERQTALF
jgi:orotate phosphoribosyltransferase-like protein